MLMTNETPDAPQPSIARLFAQRCREVDIGITVVAFTLGYLRPLIIDFFRPKGPAAH